VSVASRSSITGPALEIEGCATGQDAVAKFVAALENIDGVTRVGVQSSIKPGGVTAAPGGATGGSVGADCATKPSIPKFQIVAAFDAAPVPATAPASGTTTPAPTTTTPTTPTAPTTPDSSGAQQQQAAQQQSVQQANNQAQNATHYIPGN
jgi:hypothetical protein